MPKSAKGYTNRHAVPWNKPDHEQKKKLEAKKPKKVKEAKEEK